MNKLFLKIASFFCVISILCSSCKTPDVVPISITVEPENTFINPDLNSNSNFIELALLKLLQNDTIKNEAIKLMSKGLDGYFWISFEKFEYNLLENHSINLNNLIYDIIKRDFSNDVDINIYSNFLETARAEGYIPHLVFPNLDLIAQKDVDTNGFFKFNIDEINSIKGISTASFYGDNNLIKIHSINGDKIIEQNINLKNIQSLPLIIISYKIIDPCIYPGCDLGKTLIRNCIVSDLACKICNTTVNNNISNDGTGFFGSHEITVKLLTNNNSTINDGNCYAYEYNGPQLNTVPYLNKTYGMLSTIPNFDYYMSEYETGKLKKTRLPIMHFTGNSINEIKTGNALTLCYVDNYFHSFNDQPLNNKVLGGGIYRVQRFNAPPLYFAFPGHILGGIFWQLGPDNSITYNINVGSEVCDLQFLKIQNEFKFTSGCDFCKNNILGLSEKYFVNTDIGFLQNYWNKDTIIVGIAKKANSTNLPINNIIKFSTSSPICNVNIPNKTLVAELNLNNDNILDNFKLFNNNLTYIPGTQFLVTLQASFANMSSINSCGIINTNQTFNTVDDLLRAVTVFPRGQITQLEIKVYKIN